MWSFSNIIEALAHLLGMAESTLITHFNSKLTIAIFGASSFATLVVLSFILCGVLDEIMTPTSDSIPAPTLGRNVSKLNQDLEIKDKDLQTKTDDLETAQNTLKDAEAKLAWYDAAYTAQNQTLDNRAIELRDRDRIIRNQRNDLARADHRAEAAERSLRIKNDRVNSLVAQGKDRDEKTLQQANIIELQAQQIKDSARDLKAMSKRITDVNDKIWKTAAANTVADREIAELKLKVTDSEASADRHYRFALQTVVERNATIAVLEAKLRRKTPSGEHLDLLMEAHAAFNRNSQLEAELARTKDDLANLQKRNPSTSTSSSHESQQQTALHARLATTQKQLADAKTDLHLSAHNHEQALRKANPATAAAARESPSTQVKERVNRLERAAEISQNQLAAQTASIAAKTAQIATLTSNLTTQTSRLAHARKSTDRAVGKILQLREDAAQQTRAIESLAARLEANEGARQSDVENLQKLTGLLEMREREVVSFQKMLVDLSDWNGVLEKRLVLGDDGPDGFVEVEKGDVREAVVWQEEEEGELVDVEDVSDDGFDMVEADGDGVVAELCDGAPDVEVQ